MIPAARAVWAARSCGHLGKTRLRGPGGVDEREGHGSTVPRWRAGHVGAGGGGHARMRPFGVVALLEGDVLTLVEGQLVAGGEDSEVRVESQVDALLRHQLVLD